MKPTTIKAAWAVMALSFFLDKPANAQLLTPIPEAAPRGDTVASRSRPELDPLGIRAGSFLIFPKFGLDGTYDDNVFASNSNEKDDFITDIRPELSVASNFSNHALNFSTGADIGRYATYTRQDYEDFFVSGDGRLDVTRDSAFYAGGSFNREHEAPGQPDFQTDAKTPIEYNFINGFSRYVQRFGKFSGTLEGTVARLDYYNTNTEAGNSTSNNDRDRTVWSGGTRVGYELVRNYEAFVRVLGNTRRYDDTPDRDGVDRNSDGFSGVAGVALDLGGVLFGDVYAGYLAQYYDDSDLDNVGAFNAGGTLTWNVTTLTTLNARVERVVQETTQAGASSILRTVTGFSADHELLRNLILTAAFTYTNDDYQGVNRTDDFYLGGINARYLLNRNLYANLGYQFVHRTSSGNSNVTENDYDRNLVRIGIEAQL